MKSKTHFNLTAFPLAISAVVVSVVSLGSSSAIAQSIHLLETETTRAAGFRANRFSPLWIGLDDCLVGDIFLFPLELADFETYQVEVWAGGYDNDCTI